jgi:hypothetical protein
LLQRPSTGARAATGLAQQKTDLGPYLALSLAWLLAAEIVARALMQRPARS